MPTKTNITGDNAHIIHAFLIDAADATITPVRLPNHTETAAWDAARELIGCRLIEPVQLDDNHELLTDEEGWTQPQQNTVLLRREKTKPIFIGGNAVIIGFDPEQASYGSVIEKAKSFCKNLSAAKAVIIADFAAVQTAEKADGTFVIKSPMTLKAAIHEVDLKLVMGGAVL